MITKQHLKIAKIASKDETRPVLCAVSFTYNKDAHAIVLAATDGYKLAEHAVSLDEEYTPDFEKILVPAKFVTEIAKTMGSVDKLQVFENKFIIVDKEGVTKHEMRVRELTEGNYPEYEGLIPDVNDKATIVLDSKLLKEILTSVNGAVRLQVEMNSDGTVHKMGAVTIRQESDNTETRAVVMPLKS